MIKSVNLVHFKNHTDSEYELHPGINAIVGPGGSGKTSIMEAIGWAMFGALSGKKSSFEQVGHKDVGGVELLFDDYSIFKSFAGHSELRKNRIDYRQEGSGVGPYAIERKQLLVADGEMNVRETLSDILGSKRLDVLFSGLIGVTQGSIDNFFSRSTSERARHFSKVIGVDEYKKCADWLIDSWHEIKTRRLILAQEVPRMESAEQSYRDACRDFDGLRTELSDLELSLVPGAEMRVFGVSEARKGLETCLRYIDKATKEIEGIDLRLDTEEVDRALKSIAGHFCPECGVIISENKMASIKEKYQAKFDESAELLELKSKLELTIENENLLIEMVGSSMGALDVKFSKESDHLLSLMERVNILKGKISAMEPLMSEDLIEKLFSTRKQLEKAESVECKLETIRAACRKVPTIISEASTDEVSGLSTYFVKMIYEDWSINWGSDFSITVTMGDMELPFSSLSKSQKAIASLSVLLGLAKVVSPVDFILLDEPFSNMDANQVSLVATAIRTTGWFNQVILTTHRSEVEHIFDNVIEVSV